MASTGISAGLDSGTGLRERASTAKPVTHTKDAAQSAQETVQELNTREARSGKRDEEKKTFGRTPDGTVFTVPQTHDMVSQLLSPTQPKNLSDLVVIVVLASFIGLLSFCPNAVSVPLFAVIFLFWRACYNAGIGYLLYQQSNHRKLTAWAKRSRIFENPAAGKNPNATLYKLLKREMEAKIPVDYKFDEAPLEYNTWLLFRRLVDLILMSDFTAYCCFAIACGARPVGENIFLTIARWACGIALVLFNLWVKLDAHRVVKDYAWYWGDFFYLIDQELTFDGVFEMAPHPMYSVGYAGYYGISLMAASYKVLFISIVAHAAQFVFLTLVENPHIDKTYNPPVKPKRRQSQHLTAPEDSSAEPARLTDHAMFLNPQPAAVRDMLGPTNIDLCRTSDVSVLVVQGLLYSTAVLSPNTRPWQAYFVALAVLSRLWYSLGIGFILDRQSNKKKWSRHFLKYGETTDEAWRQWKGIYHLSTTMTYTTFICAAWKMYHIPADWTYGMALLRHVLGAALIVLQLWTIISIYESLGEFNWFFGDFFYEQKPKLTYSGIYRYLNNPERVIGLAGVWGTALITWSKTMFFLALLSHVLTLAFIQFVERPHMQRLYGQSLRQDSGVSKTIKSSLPQPLSKWKGSVDRMIEDTADFVEELVDNARPLIATGVENLASEIRSLFKKYPSAIALSRNPQSIAEINADEYILEVSGTPVSAISVIDRISGREGETGQKPQVFLSNIVRNQVFEYGAPIKVKWQAPISHNKRDWIGLYMVGDNASREVSRLSSQGRWVATTKDIWDASTADRGVLVDDHVTESANGQQVRQGEVVFSGDKLWWTQGIFEFRYHFAGGHNVLAISPAFEIKIPKFDEDAVVRDDSGAELRSAIEKELLPIVRNCFDQDPDIAPSTPEEEYGAGLESEGRYARRVVFAVHMMFGIEFAPAVVLADGNVRKLAWRITNAKRVLQPYSMSMSGRATPS